MYGSSGGTLYTWQTCFDPSGILCWPGWPLSLTGADSQGWTPSRDSSSCCNPKTFQPQICCGWVCAVVCRIVMLLCSVCVPSETHLLHFNALTMLIALICNTLSSIIEIWWSSSQPIFLFILLYLISSTLLISFCPCHHRTQKAGRYCDTWWKQWFPVRSF